MNTKKIVDALINNAKCSYEFDVTTGQIEKDLIGTDGTNYTQKAGLSAPCSFNDLVDVYFGPKMSCSMLIGSQIQKISNEYLMDSYLSGKTRSEINFFYPVTNEYYRALFFMYEDDNSGHIMAFVVTREIAQVENEIFTSSGERKNQLQEETEYFYKNLMNAQSCGILAYTYPGYQIVTVNAEALRMFGCENIEQIQRELVDIIHRIYYPSLDLLDELKKLRYEDKAIDFECIFNKDKENECYVIGKAKIIYSLNGRRIIYSTYVDATEMRALQAFVEKAEEGNRAKSEFLFNISHDLRTPMNAIIGYTEVLQNHWNGDEASKRYLSKLVDSSRFLMFLLNNAIELASLERGMGTVKESLANTDRFHEMIDSVMESAMNERKLHFSRSIHIEHPNVMCDQMKLRIVFLNLLSNSIKYTPTGGSIRWDVEEMPSDRDGYALFKTVISDTGIGISEDFLPHIFEQFSRERNTTISGVLGAGLGMSVVKKLVELMGGNITVESKLGEGTSVTVILPHRIVERDELLRLTKAQSDKPQKVMKGKRVLLAEDNDLNAEIALMILSDVGFVCERVADGTEVVAAIENKPEGYYDIVLMDIQMPIMDGYKATRIIRQLDGKKSQIPILAMTANVLEEDKRMAFASGMNGHIAKPIDIDKLMDALFGVLIDR